MVYRISTYNHFLNNSLTQFMYKIIKQVTRNGQKYAQESNDKLFQDFNEAYEASKGYGIIGGKEVDYHIYGRRKFVSDGIEVETHVATVGKEEQERINVKNYLKIAFPKEFKESDNFYTGESEITIDIEIMAKALNSCNLELLNHFYDSWNSESESVFGFELNRNKYIAKINHFNIKRGCERKSLVWAKIPSSIAIR